MRASLARSAGVAALCLAATAAALADPPQPSDRARCEAEVDYRPEKGEEGKDVIWVPTPDALVDRMLRLASVAPGDLVFDLGAGDGNFAIAAAKRFGARAVGIEYNPDLVRLARCLARRAGVEGQATIVEGDVFREDFSRADVLTLFLLPQINECLRHRILAMRPGARVVSHLFEMGDWDPDEKASTAHGTALLWVVPARVGGRWRFSDPSRPDDPGAFTVELEQAYQKLGGERSDRTGRRPVLGAALRGDRLRFAFRDGDGILRRFSGVVAGRAISGQVHGPDGGSVETTAALDGEFAPAPWAAMLPKCAARYRP